MDSTGDPNGEPTPGEAESDQLLAVRTVYATLTGIAVVTVPPLGVAMTAASPIFDVVAIYAVQRLGQRRVDHAAETLMDAANAAETPLPDFIDMAVSDDRRHELFARSLVIAQDTALRDKRRALGRALANGVMNDEATIDMELLFVGAIAALDEMHIRVLARIPQPDELPLGTPVTPAAAMTASRLLKEDPGVGDGVYALLGTLETRGLIVRTMRGLASVGGGVGFAEPTFKKTKLGQEILHRLAQSASD